MTPRQMIAALDEHGITANVMRISKKWYEVHVNYEVRKRYRQRRSANAFIKRLLFSTAKMPLSNGNHITENQP